jgi:hypothetical protein
MRITPAHQSAGVAINSNIHISYSTGEPTGCSDFELRNGSGKIVSTTTGAQWQWKVPGTSQSTVGSLTLQPGQALKEKAQYSIVRNGKTLASFQTGDSSVLRGKYVGDWDQPMDYSGFTAPATVPPDTINGAFRAMISDLVHHDKALTDTIFNLVKKDVPDLANPRAIYQAHIKKITYTSTNRMVRLLYWVVFSSIRKTWMAQPRIFQNPNW